MMTDIHERIKQISHKMLDAADAALAAMTPAPAAKRPRLQVERRQIANSLGVWQFCARRACARARCCRGEPSECLRCALPLLPPEMVDGFMTRGQRGRRR
jgi:hypothetical protein